jgi:hypothetical protein
MNIVLWFKKWVLYREDNCTPDGTQSWRLARINITVACRCEHTYILVHNQPYNPPSFITIYKNVKENILENDPSLF